MNFPQVSENQNCATILPFDRKKKQNTTLKMNKRSQGSRVYLKKNENKKYDSKNVALDANEFMGEFVYKNNVKRQPECKNLILFQVKDGN